jgi:hypothetical protein
MKYSIQCACGSLRASISNKPIVHAHCHCSDCRDLLNVPFHSVNAWNKEDVKVDTGAEFVALYQHPELAMEKHYCSKCGEVLFNTNVMDWRVVSQLLISKCNGNELPAEPSSNKHFFYEQRIIDINDVLPKYLRGTDGPLYKD